jgi:hypothetical protein
METRVGIHGTIARVASVLAAFFGSSVNKPGGRDLHLTVRAAEVWDPVPARTLDQMNPSLTPESRFCIFCIRPSRMGRAGQIYFYSQPCAGVLR